MMGGNGEASSPTTSKKAAMPKQEQPETNGTLEHAVASAEAETARKEAVAVMERYKSQVEEIESENDRLTNELSAARTKLASLSDDDYAEMKRVVGYVHRHMAQKPGGDVEETRWRYSLMNWGHDPLK